MSRRKTYTPEEAAELCADSGSEDDILCSNSEDSEAEDCGLGDWGLGIGVGIEDLGHGDSDDGDRDDGTQDEGDLCEGNVPVFHLISLPSILFPSYAV